jgi:hypothetical protein
MVGEGGNASLVENRFASCSDCLEVLLFRLFGELLQREQACRQQAVETALVTAFNDKEAVDALHRLVLGYDQRAQTPLKLHHASAENTATNHGAWCWTICGNSTVAT